MKSPEYPRGGLPRPPANVLRGLLTAATLLAAGPLFSAEWFLRQNQPLNVDWTTLSDWRANPNGSGASPSAWSSADTFDTNGYLLRSPTGTGTYVFAGGKLRLSGVNGTLALKTYNNGVSVFPHIVGAGGRVLNYSSGTQYVQVGQFENLNGVEFSAASGRGLKLTANTLTGPGAITVVGGGVLRLDVANAVDYTGDLVVAAGSLDFDNNLVSGGGLRIQSGTTVVLDQAVTFPSLTIAGTRFDPGSLDYLDLKALYPSIFVSGTSIGKITVRPPAVWHLKVDQPVAHDWSTLTDWNSASNGSGTTAGSLNPYDTYLVQGTGKRVRTPAASASFHGGVLALDSGAQLFLKTSAGAVSTVSALATGGNATIANGNSGITQALALGDWRIDSGTTRLSIASSNTLNLAVDRLSGAGTVQTQNGGVFNLTLGGGVDFSGTLLHLSGTLAFDSVVATGGPLSVGSAAAVKLNHSGYFTKVTVAGTQLAAGYHPYSTLHATWPARFPSGASSAFLAVYTPATSAPPQMFGVNLAGAEFYNQNNFPGTYGSQWIYPNEAEFDYYHGKGLNLIRIPFRWERMQPTLNGPLDAAELARMDTVVGYATARGMKVVLDMHNYARRRQGGTTYLIGTGPVTIASFADAWRRLANHYKNHTAIYAYGIMNEPHSTGGTWPAMAQAAVNAIREVDLTHWVAVSGDSWANAHGWAAKNPNLDIQDPTGRLVYEAHCYFDADGTGTYKYSYEAEGAYAEIGEARLADFVAWLQARGAKGFVGEYGVPGDDPRWLEALDKMLTYMQAQGLSGTYWAGGPWWPLSYPLTCEPTNNFTTDRPQMSVLELYP